MNMATTNVIERIDALLHACAWRGNGLGTSPSPDFCSEQCQKAWHTHTCTVRGGVRSVDGQVFVSWPQQPIPPDRLLGLDDRAAPMVELYEPPEAPADIPSPARPGARLRAQPSDFADPFWTSLHAAHVVRWQIPRVRASAALWELLEGLLPAAERVHAGLSVHDERGHPQQQLTDNAEQARREVAEHLRRELADWPRINAPAS